MAKRPNKSSSKPITAERRRRGQKTFSRIHRAGGKEVVDRLRALSPDFADMINDFAFGEIYSRPGLGLRERQIATVAALTALNNAPAQLEAHMEGAFNLGITREKIHEIVIQMALYGGFAAASNGLVATEAAWRAYKGAKRDSR